MSENVTSLFGHPFGLKEPQPFAVATLERWLEMAKSGEVVGVAVIGLHADGLSSYELAGKVGGYSIIGAAQITVAALIDNVVRG